MNDLFITMATLLENSFLLVLKSMSPNLIYRSDWLKQQTITFNMSFWEV